MVSPGPCLTTVLFSETENPIRVLEAGERPSVIFYRR